ncbi:hypothetical protein H7K24_05295 [Mycobacterium fragae]|uniref:DUF6542 domain-containing protein n=1 Tax=Mycobacterium fragae TaxID=1260918 RepID=UPI00111C49F9|nr:DUF6542 domain-containing protein [Mycobacterium fragae]MCV7399568.1 hypothetical protein [Mycobacterium fragae]
MSAARARSSVAGGHRSIHPNVPGVPWWAAVVVAVTTTAVGFAFDAGSGNKELTTVFSGLYVVGCVAAVLAVRQSGVFTAVVQPPLILFCAVPGAYWLFHGAKIAKLKDLLINCGYPLIERFPLMLFTSAGVLLIGLVRWYQGMAARTTARSEADTASSAKQTTWFAGKLASILGVSSADVDSAGEGTGTGPQRAHAVGRTARSAKSGSPTDSKRAAKRPAPSRSRHIRPPLDDAPDPTVDRTRRRRPTRTRDLDAVEPPRRGRLPRDPDLRGRPPREIRRDPHLRKGQPPRRSSRFDPYEPMEPYEPPPPVEPRRRPVPNGTSGATATHHPISRVRYRGSARDDDDT